MDTVHTYAKYLHDHRTSYLLTLAHCVEVGRNLRNFDDKGFCRSRPVAGLYVFVLSCLSGQLITDLLLGNALIKTFIKADLLVIIFTVWVLVFFCPGDLFWKLMQVRALQVVTTAAKELRRSFQVQDGVAVARSIHSESLLAPLILGVAKGSGSGFVMAPLMQLVQGVTITRHELLKPSIGTWLSLVVASVLTAYRHMKLAPVMPEPTLCCCLGAMMFSAAAAAHLLPLTGGAVAPVPPKKNEVAKEHAD